MAQSFHVNIFGQGWKISHVLSVEEGNLKMLTQQLRLESCQDEWGLHCLRSAIKGALICCIIKTSKIAELCSDT